MNDLQVFIFTTIATDINVKINSFCLNLALLIPNSQTQVLFNESIRKKYTIIFYSWYTERKKSSDGRELQVEIGSAQHFLSPKNLIGSFQTNDRKGNSDKARNAAIFDINHVTKYFVENDGARYPRDKILTNFEEISYLDQCRDLNLFYKEYVGEKLLLPYISYPRYEKLLSLSNN